MLCDLEYKQACYRGGIRDSKTEQFFPVIQSHPLCSIKFRKAARIV